MPYESRLKLITEPNGEQRLADPEPITEEEAARRVASLSAVLKEVQSPEFTNGAA